MPDDAKLFEEVIAQYKQVIFWMAAAFSSVALAISFVTLRLLKSKDGHIKDKESHNQDFIRVIESVTESNNRIANAIEVNTKSIEASTSATEKQNDKYNQLHIEILKAVNTAKKRKK